MTKRKLVRYCLFWLVVITFMTSGVVVAHELDPGGGGDSSGDYDFTPPYVSIESPTDRIVSGNHATIKSKAMDNKLLDKVEIYIDDQLVGTSYDGYLFGCYSVCFYSFEWFTSSYPPGSMHTVKAKAYDAAGNTGEVSKSYAIGYLIETQHYYHPNGATGAYAPALGTIAYTIIETDLFLLVMVITAHSILAESGDYDRSCFFDVTTMYYYKGERYDYNLNPEERPVGGVEGVLLDLNFEMEETNTHLADHSYAFVMDEKPDDRAFWPNFGTPNSVAATDLGIMVLSKTIDVVVGFLKLGKLFGFVISKVKDHILDKLRQGDDDPFNTCYLGAKSVKIKYSNQTPSGQTVQYPDNSFNYAYDAISRHRIQYRFDKYDHLTGQTVGLKFRVSAQYVDNTTDHTEDWCCSDWVTVEFKLA